MIRGVRNYLPGLFILIGAIILFILLPFNFKQSVWGIISTLFSSIVGVLIISFLIHSYLEKKYDKKEIDEDEEELEAFRDSDPERGKYFIPKHIAERREARREKKTLEFTIYFFAVLFIIYLLKSCTA